MSKQWLVVYTHDKFEIEFLDGATSPVEMGYRIKGYETLPLFDTIGDAIAYIDSGKVYII